MPIFTVTVQGPNGQTKTVTVNTDDMSAEVVPNTVSNEPVNDSNPFLKNKSSAVSNMVQSSDNPFLQAAAKPEAPEVLPRNFQEGVDPLANNDANVESTPVKKGGKRSTRIFRSKKNRRTRKLRR
jgi:hypothetical protein